MYSIQDLSALPIFNKFVSMHYQFQRETKDHSESFKSEGAKDVFQWTDKVKEEGEVFSHDRSIDTWFYEHHYKEGVAEVVVRAWRAPDVEWGEIVRKYYEYSVQENWKVKDETRNYERFELRNGEKRGIKTAVLPALEGVERWTERYWDKAGESEFEKVWERPDTKGGEIKNSKGDLWWGEVWSQAEDHTEKKTWHIQKDHEWGHSLSEACGKRVNEKWDLTKDSRSEERLTEDGGRRRGFRYVRKGVDWYRQEWDGLQVIGQDEGTEVLKRQQFLQEVDEVSANGHDSLLKGESTIEMLLSEAPQFAEEVAAIKQERLLIPKPDSNDIDSLLSAIRSERYLQDKQELLKKRMISETHSEHQKYYEIYTLFNKLMEESHKTMKEIALDDDAIGARDHRRHLPNTRIMRKSVFPTGHRWHHPSKVKARAITPRLRPCPGARRTTPSPSRHGPRCSHERSSWHRSRAAPRCRDLRSSNAWSTPTTCHSPSWSAPLAAGRPPCSPSGTATATTAPSPGWSPTAATTTPPVSGAASSAPCSR